MTEDAHVPMETTTQCELSKRLSDNLQVWVVQARQALDALRRLEPREEAKPHYDKLSRLHNTLAAELNIWDKYKDNPPRADKSGNFTARRFREGNPQKCVHFRGLGGSIERECCGGRKKTVPTYKCLRHGLVTQKDCKGCSQFINGSESGQTDKIVDQLILVANCYACDRVKLCLDKTEVSDRQLVVKLLSDDGARAALDVLNLNDRYAPCILPGDAQAADASDDPFEIISILERLGYVTDSSFFPFDRCIHAYPDAGAGDSGFKCSIFGDADRVRCRKCERFIHQTHLYSGGPAHLLVSSGSDGYCGHLVSHILSDNDGELCVLNFHTSEEAREFLDKRYGRPELRTPVLFVAADLSTGAAREVIEECAEVEAFLRANGFLE